MNLDTVLHFMTSSTPVSPTGEVTAQTGDFLSLFVFLAFTIICACASVILVTKNKALNSQNGTLISHLASSKFFVAIFAALAIIFACLGFSNVAFANANTLNSPVAPNVVNGYVQDDGSVEIDSYDIVVGENGCNFKDLVLNQTCEGDLGNWVVQFDESTVYEGPIDGAVIPLDSFKLVSGTVITVKLSCDMDAETAKSLIDKDIFTSSIFYKNVYTATVDFGEGSVAGAQEGWETITENKIYTKDYEEGADYSAIVAEWTNATVTPPSGLIYDGLTPDTGILTANTTFSAIYRDIVLWEGRADLGWEGEGQIYIASDGGKELIENGAKVGDVVVFHFDLDAPTFKPDWQAQIWDGHWGGQYDEIKADNYDLVGNNGNYYLTLTQEILERTTFAQGWGGSFLVQGQSLTITKLFLIKK